MPEMTHGHFADSHARPNPFGFVPDEVAVGVLLRVFATTTPILGEFVERTLKQRYDGEAKWLQVAADGLGKKIKSRFLQSPHQTLRRDVYAMVQILQNNLELPSASANDIDGVRMRGIVLQQLATEAECVLNTRTAVFHGFKPSSREVERCLRSLKGLWKRFALDEQHNDNMKDLQDEIQASKALSAVLKSLETETNR